MTVVAERELILARPPQVEIVDQVVVGRREIPLFEDSASIPPAEVQLMAKLLSEDHFSRNLLSSQMHNNSPAQSLGLERGVSAYYSFHPQRKILLIEWGEILPNGETKLHHYLNRIANSPSRRKQGIIVRSGHLAKITPFDHCRIPIALIDSLYIGKQIVKKGDPEHSIVTTLLQHGFLVIGSDGSVIKTKEIIEETDKLSVRVKSLDGFKKIITDPENPYFNTIVASVLTGRFGFLEEGKRVVPRSFESKVNWVKKMVERRGRRGGNLTLNMLEL